MNFFVLCNPVFLVTTYKDHMSIQYHNLKLSSSQGPGTNVSTCTKEWYDVKGAMRNATAADTNPSPFKDGSRSPFRDLLMGECTRYIRIDPAHTFAIDGIGKDFLASTIVMLVRMGHFGRSATPMALQNAYASMMAFCNAYKKNTSIVDFSYASLKLPNNSFLSIGIGYF